MEKETTDIVIFIVTTTLIFYRTTIYVKRVKAYHQPNTSESELLQAHPRHAFPKPSAGFAVKIQSRPLNHRPQRAA